ncbi:MAG: glycosyltransferase [Planctomycetaceae bacterium]|nr:glycosyltransferase [Planctomycetaceae bacterium]
MNNLTVTIALISYNQERFIDEAVRSVLAQDYTKLQIILSDDASTDSTFERMKEIGQSYSGSGNLIIRQSAVNRGLAQHVNEVVALATGELIVLCAGDDINAPSRASMSADYFVRNKNLSALSFGADIINDEGDLIKEHITEADMLIDRFSYWDGKAQHPHGAGRTYHKRVFDIFGPLNPQCPTEDTPLLLRSMLIGDVLISGKLGLRYRKHENNLSTPESIGKMNIDEIFIQYEKDIEIAKINNVFSSQDYTEIKDAVSSYIQRRKPDYSVPDKQQKSIFRRMTGKQGKSLLSSIRTTLRSR